MERKQASEQMITEADFMKNFFQKLSNANKSQSFDAIKSIADLIKSSTDMIELELSSLVSKYNDITADHIRALLTLRGDISSAESKCVFCKIEHLDDFLAKNIIESCLQQRNKNRNTVNIVLFADVVVQTGFFGR